MTATVSQDTLSGINAAQQQFYQAVANQAQQTLGREEGNVALTPIQTGGLGFNYNYLVNNTSGSSMVRSTYNLLDSTVVNGSLPKTVALGTPFSNALMLLLQDISWTLSTADQKTVTLAQGQATSAQSTLLTQYEGIFGPITSAQMQAAKVTTPVDYVIDYQVRQVWSGTLAANKPPLNILGSRNLQAQLPFMPSSAAPLLTPLTAYINAMESAWPMLNTQSSANYELSSIIDNIQKPTTANGGITTWDSSTPNSGSQSAVGYATNPTSAALVNALSAATPTSSLTVNFEASYSTSSQVQVKVTTGGGILLPIDDFIFGEGNGGSKFNLFSYQGTGNEATVSAVFGNPTLVHVTPEAYDQANGIGWYLAGLVSQAEANTGNPSVTGYKFTSKPTYNFAAGGDFGRFLSLAVSQYPTITVTYAQGNYSDFQQSFEQHSHWEISLLGIPLATMSQSYYEATSTQSSEEAGFKLILTPPSQAGLASYELSSYILAGAVVYPGSQPV